MVPVTMKGANGGFMGHGPVVIVGKEILLRGICGIDINIRRENTTHSVSDQILS